MFSSLPQTEREAFFDLLDEYFSTRPHLLSGGASASDPSSSLPPQINRENLERAGRFASTPLGQRVTGAAAGHAFGNKTFGNQMAKSWAHRNDGEQASQGQEEGASATGKGAPPPPPGRRGPPPTTPKPATGGIGGLTSGKSFGSLNTASTKAAFGSFINKPRGAEAAAIKETQAKPQLADHSGARVPSPRAGGAGAGLPPPPTRRGAAVRPTSVSSPSYDAAETEAAQETEEEIPVGPLGTAEALYDYEGTDAEDLRLQQGEKVALVQKVSEDWWRGRAADGREGIFPTTYVRQL